MRWIRSNSNDLLLPLLFPENFYGIFLSFFFLSLARKFCAFFCCCLLPFDLSRTNDKKKTGYAFQLVRSNALISIRYGFSDVHLLLCASIFINSCQKLKPKSNENELAAHIISNSSFNCHKKLRNILFDERQ